MENWVILSVDRLFVHTYNRKKASSEKARGSKIVIGYDDRKNHPLLRKMRFRV